MKLKSNLILAALTLLGLSIPLAQAGTSVPIQDLTLVQEQGKVVADANSFYHGGYHHGGYHHGGYHHGGYHHGGYHHGGYHHGGYHHGGYHHGGYHHGGDHHGGYHHGGYHHSKSSAKADLNGSLPVPQMKDQG